MNASQLRRAMAALPEPTTDQKPPYWDYWRLDLWRRVTGGQDPKWFLGWPCIYHTMCQAHWPNSIAFELEALRPELEYWRQAITMPHFGEPPDYFAGTDFSMNQIHQCYHLKQWQDFTGWKVAGLDRIVEFGGGYGAMCLLCRRLGFQGSYWIEDLPELSALQSFYLSKMTGGEQVYFGLPYHYKCDLFIASHSLSEISLREREQILSGLRAGAFLFVFHCEHDGIDNLEWFRQLAGSMPDYEWSSWYTEHLPNQWYQIGIKKDG